MILNEARNVKLALIFKLPLHRNELRRVNHFFAVNLVDKINRAVFAFMENLSEIFADNSKR